MKLLAIILIVLAAWIYLEKAPDHYWRPNIENKIGTVIEWDTDPLSFDFEFEFDFGFGKNSK